MKKTIFIAAAVLFTASSAAADSFKEGVESYQAGRYEAASGAFGKAVAAKPTAAAFYNLGTSHYRAGKKGKALAAFLRASQISPRDKDIAYNLEVVRAATAGNVATERNFLKERSEALLNSVSSDEAAAGFLLGAALFFLAALLQFLAIKGAAFMRNISVAILLVTGALLGWQAIDRKEPRLVITDKSVPARSGPSAKETTVLSLREGTEARLLDETQDWYYVSLPGGSSGWLPRGAVEVI